MASLTVSAAVTNAGGASPPATAVVAQVVVGNLLQSPNDLTNAVWTKTGLVATQLSDGTRLIEDISNGYHFASQGFSNSGNNTYTFTFDAKPLGRSLVVSIGDASDGAYVTFFIFAGGSMGASGVFGVGFTLLNQTITQLTTDTNGFYRCTMTVGASGTAPCSVAFLVIDSLNNQQYVGNGVSGLEITNTSLAQLPLVTGAFFVAANGNDVNLGTQAQPWATIDKVNAQLFQPNSSISFRGGDTFLGNIRAQAGVTYGSYGTGRATINPAVGGLGQGIINVDSVSNITIQDLIISAPDVTKQPRGGIRLASGGVGTNWLIQRCDIWGIRFNSHVSADFGGCVFFEGCPGVTTLKKCTIHGEAGVNSLTDLGVGGFGGSHVAPGLVTFDSCIVYNIGSAGTASLNGGIVYPPLGNGISVDGAQGGLKARYCVVHDCGGNYNNAAAGPAAFLTHQTTCPDPNVAAVQFCEGYNIRPLVGYTTVDFIMLDFDNNTVNATAQYCYAHDCYNSGFMHFDRLGAWNNCTIRKCLSVNNCEQGMTGFYELCVDTSGLQHTDHNTTYNDRVYNGVLFQNQFQGSGFVTIKSSTVTGTVNNNVGVMGQNIYGSYEPVNARNSTPPLTMTANQWFGRNGGGESYWWGPTEYSDLASWQAAAGQTGNASTLGAGPLIFKTFALNLSAADRSLCMSALATIQTVPGIDAGNSATGQPLPGARAASMRTRFTTADSPVTLPEFIVLGLALRWAETSSADALLARIEQVMTAAMEAASP